MMNLQSVQLPDKNSCMECGKRGSPEKALRRCGKCRAAAYCSVECQRANWKSHKLSCATFATEKNLNYTGVFVSQPGPKAKKGHNQRTRKDILQDLNTCAMEHNGGTFTLAAWNLLDLLKDISRAKTHVLALTLRRTTSMNPRTLYELVDAEVLPMTFMDEFFANQRLLSDSSPVSPRQMLEDDAIKNQLEGAFGVAMVISTELPPGDNRSPRQALTDVCVSTYHAIGLFEKHKRDLEALIKPSVPKEFFVQSLRNALKGGTSRPTF